MKIKALSPLLLAGTMLALLMVACTQPGTPSNQSVPTPTFALATPYAQSPAAGVCATFDGKVVTITLNVDMPSPRCAEIRSNQTLDVVNNTLSTLNISIGDFKRSMLPQETWSIDVPFGDYLAVGVHQLSVTPCCGAELWLKGK